MYSVDSSTLLRIYSLISSILSVFVVGIGIHEIPSFEEYIFKKDPPISKILKTIA
jgi:hypothetical protein